MCVRKVNAGSRAWRITKKAKFVLNPVNTQQEGCFPELKSVQVLRHFSARFGLFRAGEPFSVGSEACRHTQP